MKVEEKYWDHLEKKWKVVIRWEPRLEDFGVPEHGTQFNARTWWFRRNLNKLVARYRFDPVPGVHKRPARRFGCWYQKPKTMQERRAYYAYGNEYVRGRRRDKNLPNSYDDIRRSDCYIKRSWKKVKKEKQWQKITTMKHDEKKWFSEMQAYLEFRELLDQLAEVRI